MIIKRRKARVVKIGSLKIGGKNPIAIQSMAKAQTKNFKQTIAQIHRLEQAGCSIVRLAVKDEDDAQAIAKIKNKIRIPLVADIHFNWKLALSAIKAGADKIRLNPGNIYQRKEIKEIVLAAREHSIPIRVGLNSGSLPKIFKYRPGLSPASKMLKAAVNYLEILEDLRFRDIVVSLKCSRVIDTIEAYQRFSEVRDYPLHLGLTASGFINSGIIKSAVCLGVLLYQGLGDTIRVSLTAGPEREVVAARDILSSLGLGSFGPEIISCPTCGRTEVDVERIVNELEQKLAQTSCRLQGKPLRLAVMGCLVNGPGEAEDADLAIAFGRQEGLLYRNSKPVKKVSCSRAVGELIREYKHICV